MKGRKPKLFNEKSISTASPEAFKVVFPIPNTSKLPLIPFINVALADIDNVIDKLTHSSIAVVNAFFNMIHP